MLWLGHDAARSQHAPPEFPPPPSPPHASWGSGKASVASNCRGVPVEFASLPVRASMAPRMEAALQFQEPFSEMTVLLALDWQVASAAESTC